MNATCTRAWTSPSRGVDRKSITLYGMAKAKQNLRQRVQVIMGAEDWNQTALAKVAGTGRQTVWNWLNDPTYERIDVEFAFNIAEQSKSRFNPRWICSGEGPERAI